MTSFRVSVEPTVLKWARQSVNLTEESAAKKIGVSLEILRKWESGSAAPTYKQLKKVAEKYQRPIGVLYLQSPPFHFDTLREFRSILASEGTELPFEVLTALHRVQMQQDVMQEIFEIEELSPPSFDLSISTRLSVARAAAKIRGWLGLTNDLQAQWAKQRSSLPRLTNLIADKGILVTQVQRVPVSAMRGCALSDHAFPAIVLNGADSSSAKLFTLVHELVHVLLHKSGDTAIAPVTKERLEPASSIERFCNSLAAATLMPGAVLSNRIHQLDDVKSFMSNFRSLKELAADFGVSAEALTIRLIDLGYATWEDYAFVRNQVEEAFEKPAAQSEESPPIYYPLKVRDFGTHYLREVISAYERRDIGAADAAAYLDLKLNNLPKLKRELQRRL